jgi:vacuolar protein sorting-associated protein 13A/C
LEVVPCALPPPPDTPATMFEGIVANILNKHLGKYVQNLDTENLKVGIIDGCVELTDLQLKSEALFELGLPIEVKAGYIGKISLTIPWTSLYSLPVKVNVEDVYVLAGPITDRKYDARKEKALTLAIKHNKLAELERTKVDDDDPTPEDKSFLEKLTATIVNNIQITVSRIHIRYEDKVTMPGQPFACGIMLKSLSAETTNDQWKPTQIDAEETQINKLIHLQALSVYWNPYLPEQSLVRGKLHTTAWRNLLKNSLDNHRVMEEDFDFIMRPVSARAKLQLNKDESTTFPKQIANIIMEDIDILVSRQQFLTMLSLADSFKMMTVNQRYMKYNPNSKVKGHIKEWWKYAYTAVVEDVIRPYSWERIKAHRDRYRHYKDLYKRKLLADNENVSNQLLSLEEDLDIANILMAREQAKLEFAKEAPERATKQKEDRSWWSWVWSGADEHEDDEGEIIITHPDNKPKWLKQLNQEEKERLYKAIGYNANENKDHKLGYIATRIDLQLEHCCMSLVNYSKEVLKVTVADLTTTLEHRPDNNGLRMSLKTESFVVEGVSLEHDLIHIITSDIGVYAPSVNQVFSLDFEINPVHVEADCAVRLNVQPVEILYDEHAVTEVIAFFQVPQITSDDVLEVVTAGWNRMAQMSRAGLQYAIEQHKTLHLSVNMRSPYVVIPEYGTLHRGGNVLVMDFGKLKVESELQPKDIDLHECTMSEIETRLYDKFNITITEVKVLLADSGEDWHTAQTQPDSEFHILPSVGMQLAFFNTVKSDYKLLPQQKIEAKISTLKLHLTDEKIQWMGDFFKHIPMPHSSSMMGLDDSVDGHIEPVLYAIVIDEKAVKAEPDWNELKHIKRAVRMNSVVKKSIHKQSSVIDRSSMISTDSDHYYSASDQSDDDVDDWAKALEVPAVNDLTSTTNTISMLLRFVLGEVVVQISKSSDKIDTPYLMLRVNRLCVDAALTVYGAAIQASLGGIQLVDKIHTGPSGEYLEILSNKSDTDLISVVYRKVMADCPDFEKTYRSIEQGLIIKFSSLRMTFDRAAVLYLNDFVQGVFIGMHPHLDNELKKSSSTILSGPTDHHQAERQSLAQSLFIQGSQGDLSGPAGVTKLHLVAKLDDLNIKMCNHENEFADIQIKGFESKLLMKHTRMIIQAKMTDMSIEDLTENTLYPKVLTIEDDKVFDLKFVRYNKPNTVTAPKIPTVDSSCRVRIGRVQCIVLYKFLSEFKSFIDPFINPDTYDVYKVAAQTAVHDAIADVQDQGTRIGLNLDIRAPILLVPQHSESTNVIIVKLGDLCLKNGFEDLEVKGTNFKQNWDHMYLRLDAMQVLRGKLSLTGNVEYAHTIIEPINLKLDIKRALPPVHTDTAYEIGGKLHTVRMHLTQQDLKVLMATIRENGTETRLHVEKIDMEDYSSPYPDRLANGGPEFDPTTPVVEIEQPLLSAPEMSDLAQQTQFDFIMDGMILTLMGEEDDPLAPVSPVRDELDELSRFEIGRIDMGGMLNADSSLELLIKLQSISLDDIREHSNLAVKRLIMSNVQIPPSRKSMPLGEAMVTFEYKYSPDGNQHVNLNVDTIRINVCVPYLLMVYNFFMYAMQAPEDNHNIRAPPRAKPADHDASPEGMGKTIPDEVQPATPSTLTVSGRFRQPEIVLFAEPTEKNSRVLVLKTNMAFDYFSHQEREHLETNIRQLQIVSCVYGLSNKARSMVLFPCDLEFTRARSSSSSPISMEAKISDVYLHLSSTTLHIALDVMDTIKYDGQQGRDSMDMPYYPSSHHDLWTTKGISSERWLEPELEDPNIKNYPLVKADNAAEEFHIDMKKVQIMFEVENKDFHVPSLCVKTSLVADIEDWSRQLRIHSEIQLEVSYFNEKLAIWEPLIEPVMENEGKYRAWEVIVKMVRAHSHAMSCSTGEFKLDKGDELDGDVHFMMSRVRQKSSSTETDTDSETEMTVIKPKPLLKKQKSRHGSDRSFDSTISHHSSIQGESDSEPEGLINTLSSNLDSIFSSGDSSEGDMSEGDDDTFEEPRRYSP